MACRRGRTSLYICAVSLGAALAFGWSGPAWAADDDKVACDRAARDAEVAFTLPAGILVAIGAVESGHWPWTANVDGVAEVYQSREEAMAGLQRVRSPPPFDVDVGCFQISLRYHPSAFPTMADALDPVANARYAARFLTQLRERYGDWDHAIGMYHSGTSPLAEEYRVRTLAAWKNKPEQNQPEVVAAADAPRWRVISIADALSGVTPGGLPRIITQTSAPAGSNGGQASISEAR